MTPEQIETLYSLWNDEGPEDDEWRETLTDEEQALVDQWDNQYNSVILRLCEDILKKETAK